MIQLIYATNPTSAILVNGVVEGQSRIEQLQYGGKIKSPEEQFRAQRTENRLLGFITLPTGVLVAAGGLLIVLRRRKRLGILRKRRLQLKGLREPIISVLENPQDRERFQELAMWILGSERSNRFDKMMSLMSGSAGIGAMFAGTVYIVLGVYFLFIWKELGPPFGF